MGVPTTSIVILTCNGLDVTRACIESIREQTEQPYELVLVDNGSSDGTVEFLQSLPDAVVIENDRNLGFGAGCNQGIAASSGERILLLNNDVIVAHGWLAALHAALDEDPTVGMAGPRSNRVAGSQQVDDVGYDVATLDGMQEWAADWCASHRGERIDLGRLIGFCILGRREVFEQIGGFDLRYGLGNLEDDDLCMRARVAGWKLVVAQDSWIHHMGSQTFTNEAIDYRSLLTRNWRSFIGAWQIQPHEYDEAAGTYAPHRVLARTHFDPARHHAPLVASTDQTIIEVDAPRAVLLGACCDRWDPTGTRRMLETIMTTLGPQDDVTVVVRIDPRDASSLDALEETADAVGDACLPDITVLQARDENDVPFLRTVDAVFVSGPRSWSRRTLARHVGTRVVDHLELPQLRARRSAA